MNWTAEQEQVIWSRNRNLLVSAAAGSGKTAVLVERIIQMITDRENPVDIDQLLVMTFTNAAAAEMRERIGDAIYKKLEEDPDNEHLQVQSTLVHHAQIMTIDSFCLSLIRDHFNCLDIDPGFRIGDEGELLLLRADVMEEMLEAHYEQADETFEQFVDTYASGKADGGIEDLILQVYTFSQSNPWPGQWIRQCKQELEELEEGHLEATAWMSFLLEDVRKQADELYCQLEEALELCSEDGGPYMYIPTLEQDLELLDEICNARDYKTLNQCLQEVSFGRLAAARGKDLDPEKKQMAADCRDRVKKAVGALKESYGFAKLSEMMEDLCRTREVVAELLCLAEEFASRYQEKKREKNIVDFNDLEHYALEILIHLEDGNTVYTPVADELSRQYYEILVDEYQDSNYVQEALIGSLSSERFGRPNVFMVGDVKQSIYKFRLARPELFLDKYEHYTTEESKHQKIELHQNFRSRASVLESINNVFYAVMTKNLGNIQYTKETALHPGAEFALCEEGSAGTKTELLLVNTGRGETRQEEEEMADYTSREIEARLIAARIRELTDPKDGLMIWDKKQGTYRIARGGDMVILLRSISGWSDSFLNVLTEEGIPAYTESGTGYFNTVEVETVLSMLAVIDNPMQDIPLAAVLRSPIAGVTDEELAGMMADYKKDTDKGQDRGLYGAWKRYLAYGQPGETLFEKLDQFKGFLDKMRDRASYLPIHEILYQVFTETGYYDYVSAMSAGETRRANLDMLVEKASAYEKTSYKGLFHFIRYIEKLKKYDTDFGEAVTAADADHTVRLMSIHKSKGLEFPIVFLAGMGKNFNRQDVRGKILIDADLGIGTDFLDLEHRLKITTLKKQVLKRKLDMDNLGEELRVLYVAMTRAKEKLIMTGTDRYLDKKMEKWSRIPWNGTMIPYTILSSANSYLDWILMSLSKQTSNIETREILLEDLVGHQVIRQVKKRVSRDTLKQLDPSLVWDEAFGEELRSSLEYQYPGQAETTLYTKVSVSELKRQSQQSEEPDQLEQPYIPKFLQSEEMAEETRNQEERMAYGARRGSAFHRLLELLDFTSIDSFKALEDQIETLVVQEKITTEAVQTVSKTVIWNFLCSPLGQRIRNAQEHGTCHREQQFVMGIPAREMELADSDELVLVQGIIDVYLEEGDHLILIDYKTDRVEEEKLLADRYRTQLDYYQRALEQMKGKKVTEKIIYSLHLQKMIRILDGEGSQM